MKEYQTPQREQSRPSDLLNRKSKESQLKKPLKIAKKSLNVAFSSVSEDASLKESSDLSVITEVSDANRSSDVADSFASYTPLDLTPTSNVKLEESPKDIVACHDLTKSTSVSTLGSRLSATDFKLTEKALRQVSCKVLDLVGSDTETKKLVDAILRTTIDGFGTLPEERLRQGEDVFIKFRIVYLCFLLCIVVGAFISVFSSALDSSISGPPPT